MQFLDCDDCQWYIGQRTGKIVCAALIQSLGELERDPPYPGECRLKNKKEGTPRPKPVHEETWVWDES